MSEDILRRYLKENGFDKSYKLQPIDKSNLQNLLDRGLTLKEIAGMINKSEPTVTKWINIYGLHRSEEGQRIYEFNRAANSRNRNLQRCGGECRNDLSCSFT